MRFFRKMLFLWLLAAGFLLLPPSAKAEVGSALEFAKLAEIVTQLTELLRKTEQLIEVQEALRNFEVRSLGVPLFEALLATGTDFGLEEGWLGLELPELQALETLNAELTAFSRQAAELGRQGAALGRQWELVQEQGGLYLVADSLRLLIEAAEYSAAATQLLEQVQELELNGGLTVNLEDQQLARIHKLLAEDYSLQLRETLQQELRDALQQDILFSSFQLFSDFNE